MSPDMMANDTAIGDPVVYDSRDEHGTKLEIGRLIYTGEGLINRRGIDWVSMRLFEMEKYFSQYSSMYMPLF